ncbi:hypothetical protein [Actinoplanes sp. NPDC048796]|uniref:hypothetical protein n=1 Tax=unclassified Actinoplanes TaxID=2626549 RepID=UPI0033DAB13A
MSSHWYRNRYTGVAAILLAVSAGAAALVHSPGSEAEPPDLRTQITDRMRVTLEKSDPGQHHHAGHATTPGTAPVICGVHLYGFEPAGATELAEVRTVYGFHLCGVAERKSPWDVAVKLAGPVIVDMATDPPGIQPVEATEDVRFVDRLRQMFPGPYAELAQKEALTPDEMTELRRRYDDAAG